MIKPSIWVGVISSRYVRIFDHSLGCNEFPDESTAALRVRSARNIPGIDTLIHRKRFRLHRAYKTADSPSVIPSPDQGISAMKRYPLHIDLVDIRAAHKTTRRVSISAGSDLDIVSIYLDIF